jgi:hypothetical protein
LILREVSVVEFDCHLFVYLIVLFVRSFAAAGRFEEKEDRSVGVGGEGALTNDPQARHGLCQAMYLRSRETVSGTPAANDQLKDRGAAQEYSHTLLRCCWAAVDRFGCVVLVLVLVAVVTANSNVFWESHHREESC